MKVLLAIFAILVLAPLSAEDVWTLRTGPEAVGSIPLDTVQMVSAWRGKYSDGTDLVWLYATRSPQFFTPKSPDIVIISGTPWTVVLFFPTSWKPAERTVWRERWVADFRVLFSLPEPGYPIVFPSVLRKS